jgi:hypothetical protein
MAYQEEALSDEELAEKFYEDDATKGHLYGPSFAVVPRSLVFNTSISHAAVRVYAAVYRYSSGGEKHGSRDLSVKKLAALLRMSQVTVRRAFELLEAEGYLRFAELSDDEGAPYSYYEFGRNT